MLTTAGLGIGPHHYRLWSLWNMLRVYALKYIELGDAVAKVRSDFYHVAELGQPLSAGERQELRAALAELATVCSDMELKVQAGLVQRAENDLPQTSRELEMLLAAVYAELKSRICLYLPLSRSQYYEWDEIVSDPVKTAFPAASAEIRDAATCFALDRYTAAVFHAMRAAEIGARTLGEALQLDLAEWQPILDRVHAKVRDLGQQPKSSEREADQAFFGQAAAQLQFFKDGWRVRVMHARATYNENQAREVIDHVRKFFETLSQRLAE